MFPRVRSDIFTIVAVGVAAYALGDVVHEAAGHGTAALMTPGPIASSLILSSVVSSGFAAMAGLTLVPGMVERHTDADESGAGFVPRSHG